jgi:putative transcriptional regulator
MAKLIEDTKVIIRLKEMRAVRNLSQGKVAVLCEMSVSNLQQYEHGKMKSIPFKTLEKFCRVLKCQPGDLIVLESDEETATE